MMTVIQLTGAGRFLSERYWKNLSQKEPVMRKFVLVAAIASLSLVTASLASAQEAISEPGAYAFYHPNGDLLHAGPGYNTLSRADPRDAFAALPAGKPARGHKPVHRTE
jgi:hypothetical protein